MKLYNLALNSVYQQRFLATGLTLTSQDCCDKSENNIVQQPFCRNGNGESRSVVIHLQKNSPLFVNKLMFVLIDSYVEIKNLRI